MDSFGDIIKKKREEKLLYLRQASALLEIDQALISKFERGDRKPSKEQVLKFAKFYELDTKDLLLAWYSDKVAYEIWNEDNAEEILKVADSKIKYLRKK